MRLRGRASRAAAHLDNPAVHAAPVAGDAGGRVTVLVGVVQATHLLHFDFTPSAGRGSRGA